MNEENQENLEVEKNGDGEEWNHNDSVYIIMFYIQFKFKKIKK